MADGADNMACGSATEVVRCFADRAAASRGGRHLRSDARFRGSRLSPRSVRAEQCLLGEFERYIFDASAAGDVCEFVHTIGRGSPLELDALIQRHPLLDGEPMVLVSGIAYAGDEATAREELAMLESCPARSRAIRAATKNLRRLDELRADWDPDERVRLVARARSTSGMSARDAEPESSRTAWRRCAKYAEFIYAHNEREQPVRAVRAGIVNVL